MYRFFIFLAALFTGVSAMAFDRTLRVDYIFSGDCSNTSVSLSAMSVTDGWYGRSVNLDSVPVQGNGCITVTDSASGEVIYTNSFSTLFQEWQATPEAKTVVKAFQNTFLLPMPEKPATVCVSLYDSKRNKVCEYTHPVDPADILIEHQQVSEVENRYISRGGDPLTCIDVVILAEGYTSEEMDTFYKDAETAVEAILTHEPFASKRDRFNFLAVACPSEDSGVSVPRKGEWRSTAVGSHFDTFYSDRYLTTTNVFRMHDILSGLPYEHIVILANTDVYGGGGIYNSYTLTTAHHANFRPVVVHEFGHSFGALADEYDYAGEEDPYYFPDVEPWEQNITTQFRFDTKWKDMIDTGVPGVGLVEGAGYQAHGVWRPTPDCRMRTNTAAEFCPVCRRAIERMIEFSTASDN